MAVFRHLLLALFALGLTLAPARLARASDSVNNDLPVHVLAPDYAVSAQMQVQDIKAAAADGYVLIINNRPDGESAGQPRSADLARAAAEAGIAYVHIPFAPGHLSADVVQKMQTAMAAHPGKTRAFCRSGGRATSAWAMSKTALGEIEPDAAIKAAARAGYDLRRQRARLQAAAAGQ